MEKIKNEFVIAKELLSQREVLIVLACLVALLLFVGAVRLFG